LLLLLLLFVVVQEEIARLLPIRVYLCFAIRFNSFVARCTRTYSNLFLGAVNSAATQGEAKEDIEFTDDIVEKKCCR